MNEFMDFELGLMVALPEVAGCYGCAYDHRPCPDVGGIGSYCSRDTRDDGRGIIWVRAPKVVRLADEQILAALPDCHGSSLGRSWLLSAARDIERAVLRANNLETPECPRTFCA